MIGVTTLKKTTQDVSRNVFIAGLGVLSIATETSQKAFGTLVERGKLKQDSKQDSKSEGGSLTSTILNKTQDVKNTVVALVQKPIKGTMTTLGLPTSNEIEELNQRIVALTEKINALAPASK